MTEFRDRIVEMVRVPASELIPDVRNWRGHPPAQRDALTAVLDEVGIAGAVLARRDADGRLVLVDGHLRADMLDQEVPVLVLDLDEAEAGLILATHDPIVEMAERDGQALTDLIGSLDAGGDALRDLLASLADPIPVEPLTDPNFVPEVLGEPITKPGDLWLLGEHRVLCGDATDEAAYERVLGGGRTHLCLTDPPYGVGVEYEGYEDSEAELLALIDAALPLVIGSCDVVLVTPGNSNQSLYPRPVWTLCWAEPAGVGANPWGFTCWQPILAYGRDPYLARGLGRRPDTFIGTGEGASSADHPVAKPMKVWSWLMERGTTEPGQKVLDPFIGSGTTLIAAELLGRVAYGVEQSPRYVDTTVARWEALTGQKATLESAKKPS